MRVRVVALVVLSASLVSACGRAASDVARADATKEQSAAATGVARVFFTSGGCRSDAAVDRAVPESRTPESTALLSGPSEEERGRGLAFVTNSHAVLRRLHIEGGTAFVDLSESFVSVNNISTACAGRIFVEGVENTLARFSTVERVRYAVSGRPATFYELMQLACPIPCDAQPFQD